MPNISSPNLAGITDMQVLNALRVIQANIEALARAIPENPAEKGSVGTLRNELYQLQGRVDNLKVSYSGTNGIHAGPFGDKQYTFVVNSEDLLQYSSTNSMILFGRQGGLTFKYSSSTGGDQEIYFGIGPNYAVTYQHDATTPCGLYAKNPTFDGPVKMSVPYNGERLVKKDFAKWVVDDIYTPFASTIEGMRSQISVNQTSLGNLWTDHNVLVTNTNAGLSSLQEQIGSLWEAIAALGEP